MTEPTNATRKPRRIARLPKDEANGATTTQQSNPTSKPKSKSVLVLELLQRPKGASLDQLIAVTGWLPHTTRAALTGLRKKGHNVSSEKTEDGPRVYRVSSVGGAAQ